MQAGGKDLVNAGILQIGLELASTAQGLARGVVGHHSEIAHHLVQAGGQAARHVGPQDQQLGHALGRDHVAVDLAVDLEAGHRAQDRAPVIEVVLLILFAGGTEEVALHRVELHVQQARRVVGPLQEGAHAVEVEGLVLQHGAHRHAAREVRAVLDPFEERAGVALEVLGLEVTRQLEPGGVLRFPQLGGQRAAHGPRVFTRCAQAGGDARRVGLVAHHEVHDVARRDVLAVFGGVAGHEFADDQQAFPAHLRDGGRLRQQRGLVADVEHARGVFGALGVTGHPEKVIGGARKHVNDSGKQRHKSSERNGPTERHRGTGFAGPLVPPPFQGG
ncbi:hypothetical protein FQZ97_798750 [compost metagenome]